MGLFDFINDEAKTVGGSMADLVYARPDASGVHSADATAATAPAHQDLGLFGSIAQGIGDFGRGIAQEGLSGLLDPSGVIDRQQAQHELAARFNVVAPGTPGAGTQNTVTQEEFQQISRQYSDIRMGRSDIQIGTDGMNDEQAAAFRQGTMNDIASMMQTNSGRGLIGDLQTGRNADGTHRTTTISRINDDDFANAGGKGGGRFSDDTHKSGFVQYRPGEVALPGNVDARSDIALMHELTHANESIHNSFASGSITAAEGGTAADVAAGTSRSEYQAAGMGTVANRGYSENAYRRDRAAIGASGSGMRNDQGHSDVGMGVRTTYNYPSSGSGSGGSGGGHLGVGTRPHAHDEDEEEGG